MKVTERALRDISTTGTLSEQGQRSEQRDSPGDVTQMLTRCSLPKKHDPAEEPQIRVLGTLGGMTVRSRERREGTVIVPADVSLSLL